LCIVLSRLRRDVEGWDGCNGGGIEIRFEDGNCVGITDALYSFLKFWLVEQFVLKKAPKICSPNIYWSIIVIARHSKCVPVWTMQWTLCTTSQECNAEQYMAHQCIWRNWWITGASTKKNTVNWCIRIMCYLIWLCLMK